MKCRRAGKNSVEHKDDVATLKRMIFLRFSLLTIFAFVLSGCMFIPFFDDTDAKKNSQTVSENIARMETEQQERMRSNSNIRNAEYDRFHGNETKLPPKPTTAELEKIVEADKQQSR